MGMGLTVNSIKALLTEKTAAAWRAEEQGGKTERV